MTLLTLQGTEPRATLTVDEGHSVEALAGYGKGFVAGLDGGLVALFDRDEKEYFRRTRTFTIHDHALPVRSASHAEDDLVYNLRHCWAITAIMAVGPDYLQQLQFGRRHHLHVPAGCSK